jgi:hypothetical protein
MTIRRAACSCGRLHLTIEGEPSRISMCHCLECQRRTGAVISNQARFLGNQVTFAGKATSWTRTAESGNALTFHFCPTCGSTVYWENEGACHIEQVKAVFSCDPARLSRWNRATGPSSFSAMWILRRRFGPDHPSRAIRGLVNADLSRLERESSALCLTIGGHRSPRKAVGRCCWRHFIRSAPTAFDGAAGIPLASGIDIDDGASDSVFSANRDRFLPGPWRRSFSARSCCSRG